MCPKPDYIHRADVMTRLPALLLAGCAVLTGLILVGSTSSDSPLFEKSPPATEIRTGAQAREIAEQPHGGMQRSPEATSSVHDDDLRPPEVRLSGIVIEPDRRIAMFAVNGAKSVVLSEGEPLKDWRVESISPQGVLLNGPAGTMTLKPKPDANLVRPAAVVTSQPQPEAPSRFLHPPFQWFPAPVGPPMPTAATLIAAVPGPAPVQDYYDYAPYSYDDYLLPYYAYGVPVGFGFRFFHHHDFHPRAFHRAFRNGGFPGVFPGGRIHAAFHGVGFHAGVGGHGGHR